MTKLVLEKPGKGIKEMKSMIKKWGCMTVLTVLMLVVLTGCEQLKEKEPEMPGRTKGKESYTGFENIDSDYSTEDVINGGGMVCTQTGITGGRTNWDHFMKTVGEKKSARIRIMQKISGEDAFYKDVIYDGEEFRMIVSVNPEEYDFTYKYLLDLKGRRTKKSKESHLVILTDEEELPFETVIENESGRKKCEENYQLIFRE